MRRPRPLDLILLALLLPSVALAQVRRPTRAARAGQQPAARVAHTWTAVSAGAAYTCALDATGQAYCWGENLNRKLGIADSVNIRRPVPVETPQRFTAISAGVFETCALTREGAAVCWGGDINPSMPHVAMGTTRLRQLDLRNNVGCGVTVDGNALCWGSNSAGQLGSGRSSATPSFHPEQVRGGRRWRQVTAGGSAACGIAENGSAWCWGAAGQLGTMARGNSSVPVEVAGRHQFTQLAAGLQHVCGIDTKGAAFCWGDNNHGALGSTRGGQGAPAPVDGGLAFKQLSAGYAFTCGLTTAGKAYCWGWNQRGALGTGNTDDAAAPAAVAPNLTFTAISSGSNHTCAIATDGALYCWGDNADGELGIARSQTCRTPVAGGRAEVRPCALVPTRVQDPR